MLRQSYLLLLTILFFSCSSGDKDELAKVNPIASPASQSSEEPFLFTAEDGDVYLSWIERKENKDQFKFSKMIDGKWSTSQLISEGDNWFVNWADYPSIMVNSEVMAAHWLQKRAEGTYDYDVRMSLSANEGSAWDESFIPHTDGVSAEHGFVSMLPMTNNRTFATWLDGRFTKGEEHSEGSLGGVGAMTLRAAIFDKNGKSESEWELDNRVCDCCQTTAAMTSNGPIVIYRNRTEDEIRDMAIVRWENNAWTEPSIVHADDWNIAGCPVNGPSVAANKDFVAVSWFTASNANPTVKLSVSEDAGKNFAEPIVISQGNTNGRVGTTLLADNSIVVTWMETKNDAAQILLGHFDKSGNHLATKTIAQSSAARSSGFPVVSSTGNKVILAWTEVGENKQVQTASVQF